MTISSRRKIKIKVQSYVLDKVPYRMASHRLALLRTISFGDSRDDYNDDDDDDDVEDDDDDDEDKDDGDNDQNDNV